MGVESVVIGLGSERYALHVKHVQSIEKPMEVTSLPRSADYVIGYVDYRDSISTLMDLGELLGMESIEMSGSTRDVFVVLGGGEVIGLRVDEVFEVVELSDVDEDSLGGYHLNFLDEYINVSRHEDSFVLVIDVDLMLEKTRMVENISRLDEQLIEVSE